MASNVEKITLEELRGMADQARGKISHVYYHWSASPYWADCENQDEIAADYHLLFDELGNMYRTTTDLSEYKEHTYDRNTGAVGMAFVGCVDAVGIDDMGTKPPTKIAIEAMAQASAVLSIGLALPIDIYHFLTHAEAGDDKDGVHPNYAPNGFPYGCYGPDNSVERWDLLVVEQDAERWSGGGVIRGKGNWYKNSGI